MPIQQAASVAVFPFASPGTGTPGASNIALKFRNPDTKGRRGVLTFSAPIDGALTVTVQVSPDDSTYTTTSAGQNITAISAVSIPAGTTKSYEVLFREGTDKYVRVLATGGYRGEMTTRLPLTPVPL